MIRSAYRPMWLIAMFDLPVTSKLARKRATEFRACLLDGGFIMLQYSVYSVISPEGCASILWKTADRAADAAEALGLTAHRLKALNLIDKIVNEPLGGAHRDPKQMAVLLKRALADSLRQFQGMKTKDLLAARHEKLMSYGKFKELNTAE